MKIFWKISFWYKGETFSFTFDYKIRLDEILKCIDEQYGRNI